jgi:hypothetical protein
MFRDCPFNHSCFLVTSPVLAGVRNEPLPPLLTPRNVCGRSHHLLSIRRSRSPLSQMGRRTQMGRWTHAPLSHMGGGKRRAEAPVRRHLPGGIVGGGEVAQQVVQVVDVLLNGLLGVRGGGRRVLVAAERDSSVRLFRTRRKK